MQFSCVSFTATELHPPDPLIFTLSPLLYTYKIGDSLRKDKEIFEIIHSVCVCVSRTEHIVSALENSWPVNKEDLVGHGECRRG